MNIKLLATAVFSIAAISSPSMANDVVFNLKCTTTNADDNSPFTVGSVVYFIGRVVPTTKYTTSYVISDILTPPYAHDTGNIKIQVDAPDALSDAQYAYANGAPNTSVFTLKDDYASVLISPKYGVNCGGHANCDISIRVNMTTGYSPIEGRNIGIFTKWAGLSHSAYSYGHCEKNIKQ